MADGYDLLDAEMTPALPPELAPIPAAPVPARAAPALPPELAPIPAAPVPARAAPALPPELAPIPAAPPAAADGYALLDQALQPSAPSYVPDLGLTAGVPIAPPAAEDKQAQERRAAMLKGTDTATGAPIGVRASVGAASSPDDRLATLKKYYPDAQPLPGGGDNFVYTDPTTGKRMTYAPIGWRIPTAGDIASLIPEAAEAAGGTIGGVIAAPGVVTTPVGVGLGAAAGKEAAQLIARLSGATVDTRTPVQQVTDAATTAGLNTVLPVIGEKVGGPIIASLLRPDAPTATQVAAKALVDSGAAPPSLLRVMPAGVQAESPGWQRVEQAVAAFPASGGLRTDYEASREALNETALNVAAKAAPGQPVPNAETFSNNVAAVANRINDRFQTGRMAADDHAMSLIGEDTPVDLSPLQDVRDQLQTALAKAPVSLLGRYGPALDKINKVLGDASQFGTATDSGGPALPFSVVRNIRTDLGKDIDFTASGNAVPTGLPALKQTYGALKDSLLNTAEQQGPEAYAALADHDAMVERFNSGPAQMVKDLSDPSNRANVIARLAQSTAPGDAQSLAHLVMYATPAERQQIAAGVLNQIGTKPDGTFDMPTWLTNYGKMQDAQKNMLFGATSAPGSLQADLNNLATVQQQFRSSAGLANTSRTAPVLAMLQAIGAITGAAASGDISHAAALAAGSIGGPSIVGRLMSSQPFVRWLTGTYGVNARTAGSWANHLARLGTVAQADPSVADLVARLRQQLPDQLPQQPQQ